MALDPPPARDVPSESAIAAAAASAPGLFFFLFASADAVARLIVGNQINLSLTWTNIGTVAMFGAFGSLIATPLAIVSAALAWRKLESRGRRIVISLVVLAALGTLRFVLGMSV